MVQVIAEITYKCPAKCPFCPLRNMQRTDTMSIEDYIKALRLFRDFFDGDMAVVLSGGEPSMLENLGDYVRVAKDLGYVVTIVTNGYIPERALEARPDAIEVSIDYFDKKHDKTRGINGLFKNALKILMDAEKYDIQPIVRSIIMKDNIEDIIKLKKFVAMRELAWGEIPVIAMPIRGCPEKLPSKEDIERLMEHEVIVSNNCPAGISSFVLTPSMDVLACIFYRKKLGQLKEFTKEELEEILRNGKKLPRFPCEH